MNDKARGRGKERSAADKQADKQAVQRAAPARQVVMIAQRLMQGLVRENDTLVLRSYGEIVQAVGASLEGMGRADDGATLQAMGQQIITEAGEPDPIEPMPEGAGGPPGRRAWMERRAAGQ